MPELEDIQRQIHGEISSLQENLKSLNTIRLEFEQAKNLVKEHITKVDEYIRSIQTHSTNLQNLLLRYADEIKEHTIEEINRAISSLEAVSNEIIRTVNSLKEEIKNLLQTNKELIQEAKELFKQIDEINLPKRFDELEKSLYDINEKITRLENKVEAYFISIKAEIDDIHRSNSRLKKQNKLLLYFLIGISVIAIMTLIILIMK